MINLHGDTGLIIILNGPSSVGKTSIQKALQKNSQMHFLRVGIDTFFDNLIEEPDLSHFQITKKLEQFTPSGELIRSVEFLEDENHFPIVPLTIGPAGDRIIYGMHRALAAYAEVGNHLIVDYILYKPEWADNLKEVLKNSPTLFIKVHAPLDVIETREKERNTSPQGHARSHYDTVHLGLEYDLEIDTSLMSPDESAHLIQKMIEEKQFYRS